jgi:23S rRNA pseudouridine1911/1915/1917 synthase
VIFAKTSKALSRLNEMFRKDSIDKVYWAIVKNRPSKIEDKLVHYLIKDEKKNKSSAFNTEKPNTKKAVMHYKLISTSQNYSLLEVNLETGRHHQIRCQLAKIGSPIKGDLKYGAERSNPDGSISLHARSISFIHPVSKVKIEVTAPVPMDNLWKSFEESVRDR